MSCVVVYPGTFDPITLGHLDIIRRSASAFDKVIVAVVSHGKKDTLFDANERLKMVQEEIAHFHTKNVSASLFSGLLVNFAYSNSARFIIRGIRAVSDFEYEFKMAYINRKMNSHIETLFLPTTMGDISSSLVKEIAEFDGNLKDLVSNTVAIHLKRKCIK